MHVHLRIKDDMLRTYLAARFEREDDAFVASAQNPVGAAICALAKPTPRPYRRPGRKTDDVVKFRLSEADYNAPKRLRYLTLSAASEQLINRLLRREFDADLATFCASCKGTGMKQKEAIEAFMYDRGIDEFYFGDIEALRKKAYRQELSNFFDARERLRQRLLHLTRKNRKKIKNF